ncbi:MAG: hypothetical protein P4L85_22775 [Paludisphaera borealis]|uniref:hypothetical protein n=1 Tax=Paludisphaera borealis TaxID=1387353 RepID=UPI00283D726B|nr:hypothetical protein [Paludisphaera borealis]MDR3622192.1 hypothetical protein [Paludisphaera borealis]
MNRKTTIWAVCLGFSLSFTAASPRSRADAIGSSYSITGLGQYIPVGLNDQGQVNLVPEGAGGFMGYSEFYSAVPEGQRNQSAQYTYSSLGNQAGSLSTPNLPQPSRTADGSWIYAYNQAGDTTGWDSQRQTYVNIGGVRTQIGVGDNSSTRTNPVAINDAGQVIGNIVTSGGANSQAFLYSGGLLKQIGDLGGGNSMARGINSSGVVVGWSNVSAADAGQGSSMRGFIYDGTIHQLGDGANLAYAINNAGLVVGSRFQDAAADDNRLRAFMMKDGVLTDLNSLLPTGSGWLLTAALGVNNLGQIIGVGTHDGKENAFLLSPSSVVPPLDTPEVPVPEPASVVCFATLIVAGLIRASRKREPLARA